MRHLCPRPAELLLIDPLHAGRWPRPTPLFDPKRSKALQRQAKAARKARRREQENLLRDLEGGAALLGARRGAVLQVADALLAGRSPPRWAPPARRPSSRDLVIQGLRDEERRIEKDKRTQARQRRRAEATDRYRKVRAQARRTLGLKVVGHVPCGEWMQTVGKNGEPRWTMLAPGCFDSSIKNRLRIDPPIHLQVDHSGDEVNLVDDLTVLPTRSGLLFRTRIAHDDVALWRIRKMREMSPRYLPIRVETDQYVHPWDRAEQDRVTEAVLLELSFVERSSNPGSWVFVEEREEAAA
ncbi:MAG: hypothetical protein ACYSUM_15890 [Planctomycetota bacterium]